MNSDNVCPKCGESFSEPFAYCPWDGEPLETTEPDETENDAK